jgi:hypothetical protein
MGTRHYKLEREGEREKLKVREVLDQKKKIPNRLADLVHSQIFALAEHRREGGDFNLIGPIICLLANYFL